MTDDELPARQTTDSITFTLHSLRCFYFVVDTIRSIHFHTPSTVEPNWSIKMGNNRQHDLRDLCDGLILDGRSLPAGLTVDEYLLVIFDLLSKINTLFSSLGPLISASWTTRRKLSRLLDHQATEPGSPTRVDDVAHPDPGPRVISINPFVPLTADREFKQLSNSLGAMAMVWSGGPRMSRRWRYRRSSPPHSSAAITV